MTGDETSLRIADALGPGCSDVCLSLSARMWMWMFAISSRLRLLRVRSFSETLTVRKRGGGSVASLYTSIRFVNQECGVIRVLK